MACKAKHNSERRKNQKCLISDKMDVVRDNKCDALLDLLMNEYKVTQKQYI